MRKPTLTIVPECDPVYGTLAEANDLDYNSKKPDKAQRVQKTLISDLKEAPVLMTVKALSNHFGITQANIYFLIRTEPSFPYVNVGNKKKYMVHLQKFVEWLDKRSTADKAERFNLPSSVQLMARFKK